MLHKPKPLIAALKIWLTGVLLGPVLLGVGASFYSLYSGGNANFGGELFFMYLLLALYGGFFSLPSALGLWLVISLQYRFKQQEFTFWATILTATFIFTAAPFYVFMADIDDVGFIAAYLGAIWVGVFWTFYRVKMRPEIDPGEPLDANM